MISPSIKRSERGSRSGQASVRANVVVVSECGTVQGVIITGLRDKERGREKGREGEEADQD